MMGKLFGGLLLLAGLGHALADEPAQNVIFVFDASGSMWAEMEGGHRITVAREVMREVVDDLDGSTNVALVAYGHNRRGDCGDIETLIGMGTLEKAAFMRTVDSINPRGMTPITGSVSHALDLLKTSEHAASVVLISDGLENCGGDPCAAVRAAAAMDIDFTFHVVGFAMGNEDTSQLQCMAEAGGGRYVSADSTHELTEALRIVLAPEPELPTTGLLLGVNVLGEPIERGAVRIIESETGVELVGSGGPAGWLGTSNPNPRFFAVPAGVYEVWLEGGDTLAEGQWFRAVEVAEGETVERILELGPGTLVLGVTVNQQPWDARVRVVDAASEQDMIRDFGTTMLSGRNNPRSYSLPAGVYDVEFTGNRLLGGPAWVRGVEVSAGQQTEQIHDFELGTLKLGLTQNGRPLEGRVKIVDPSTGQDLIRDFGTSRIGNANPRSYELPAGIYDVEFTGSGILGEAAWVRGVEVSAGRQAEQIHDFQLGTLKLGLTHNGRPLEGRVKIVNQATGRDMIRDFGTSRIGNANPRSYELPAGIYDVEFTGSGIQAEPIRRSGIQLRAGQTIEQIVGFD